MPSRPKPLFNLPQDEIIYVPILKGKAGELGALKELSQNLKSKIFPLIEFPPVPWDYIKGKQAKTIENHLDDVLKRVVNSWDPSYPIMIDTSLIEENGFDSIDYILKELLSKKVSVIPVISFENDDKFLESIRRNLKDPARICLRINQEQLDKFSPVQIAASDIFEKLNTSQEYTDLILDFEYLTSEQESMFTSYSRMVINSFPDIEKYRTLSLCMSSFPENLSEQDSSSTKIIERSEWVVWNRLLEANSIKRMPIYGDYGISNPSIQDIDPRIMQMSANIRYTIDEGWFILKGKGVKRSGFEQFYTLSELLVNSGKYYGENYSWGDKKINQKSKKIGGTGNATTWRQIGTNHHLTVVMNQILSNSPSS